MKLKNLHEASYNQLTTYYNDLSVPMDALRRHILEIVLLGKKPESTLEFIGNFAVRENLIPSLDIKNSILDVGCANGDNLNLMHQMGFNHLSGIDMAPEMVSAAKKKLDYPIQCNDMFDYEGPRADLVFAQALVHLFPKKDLPKVIIHLLSICKQRLYFSTTIHDTPCEGLEPKLSVIRYRSRYTKGELLTTINNVLVKVNNTHTTWRVFYFFLTDCLGKYWINVLFDKIELANCYANDGIIIHRRLFDKSTTEKLSKELDYFATNTALPNTWLRYDDHVFDRVENFIPFLSSSSRMALNSDHIFTLLAKCFGNKVAILKDKCNFKLPGKSAFPLHQDAAAGWENSGYGDKHITMAISLDHASLENGALQFALGKHREGLLSPLYEVMSEEYLKTWDFHPVCMAPGDAIIFDSYLPHYSKINNSCSSRKIIFLTFIDAKYTDIAKDFFSAKRLRQPPIDERNEYMQLVRNEYGKWIRKE